MKSYKLIAHHEKHESQKRRKTRVGFFKVGENKGISQGNALGLNKERELGARDITKAKRQIVKTEAGVKCFRKFKQDDI